MQLLSIFNKIILFINPNIKHIKKELKRMGYNISGITPLSNKELKELDILNINILPYVLSELRINSLTKGLKYNLFSMLVYPIRAITKNNELLWVYYNSELNLLFNVMPPILDSMTVYNLIDNDLSYFNKLPNFNHFNINDLEEVFVKYEEYINLDIEKSLDINRDYLGVAIFKVNDKYYKFKLEER